MSRRVFEVLVVAACGFGALCCGPACPEVLSGLDEAELMAGDVARVNDLVARRKAAVAEAEGGDLDTFAMDRIKFSVTAYELAIGDQLRIIKLSPRHGDSALYGDNRELVDMVRCNIDALLEREGHTVIDSEGRDVQRLHAQVKRVFRKEGETKGPELETYLEEGIPSAPEDEDDDEGMAPLSDDSEGGDDDWGDDEEDDDEDDGAESSDADDEDDDEL